MSKKMLFVLTVLSSACSAEDVVDNEPLAVSSDSSVVALAVHEVIPASEAPVVPVVVEEVQQLSTELPGVRIETGPVSVTPSSAITEQNVSELAQATTQALEQTLNSIVDAMIDDPLEAVEQQVIGAITQNVQAFLEFIGEYYTAFVDFFTNGWKFMTYHSVGGAARHIIEIAQERSIVLDLTSLQAVDVHAAECLAKMEVARRLILEAAASRSPELKEAADACLAQYIRWFTGESEAFVGAENTTRMLGSLGVSRVTADIFNVKNMEFFRELGGIDRHNSMFFMVSPSQESGLLARDASDEQDSENAASVDAEILDELIQEVKEEQEIVGDIQEILCKEPAEEIAEEAVLADSQE